jgi:hypothetical protein
LVLGLDSDDQLTQVYSGSSGLKALLSQSVGCPARYGNLGYGEVEVRPDGLLE